MRYTLTKSMIDPFVDIAQLADGVWSFIARSPGMGGDARTYLICGTEKATVLDTGFGLGNLLGLVRSFTDLPLITVNTHFHGDHTGGNAQFGTVYLHELDAELLKASLARPRPARYIAKDTFYTAADLIVQKPYEIRTVKAGDTFDLGGGHVLEVFHTPGHSPGGITLLEKKRRMLFTGDAIVYTPTYIFNMGEPIAVPKPYTTVEEFRDSLYVLQARRDEFDGLFPGHHNMNLSPDWIDEMIQCCTDLMKNPDDVTEIMPMHGDKTVTLHYSGRASIAFSKDRIYRGKPI